MSGTRWSVSRSSHSSEWVSQSAQASILSPGRRTFHQKILSGDSQSSPWWNSFKRNLTTTVRPAGSEPQPLKFSRPIVDFVSLKNILQKKRESTKEMGETDQDRLQIETLPHHDQQIRPDPSWKPSDSMMGNRDIFRYFIITKKDFDQPVVS